MQSAKYDRIGINYNNTRRADPHLFERMRALLNPDPSGIYLDVGCGTGNYTSKFHEAGFRFIGVDPSAQMLKTAGFNCEAIDWRQGIAEQLPLEQDAVDAALATLTLHHWTSLLLGFREVHRVLKKGSRLLIFTATTRQMKGYWLNHYFPQMLEDSISQMPTLQETEQALKTTNFSIIEKEPYFIKPDLKDQFLYCGKQDPSLYLDENIRAGISSFSALSHKAEVEKGLQQLKADINSGKVKEIMESYENLPNGQEFDSAITGRVTFFFKFN